MIEKKDNNSFKFNISKYVKIISNLVLIPVLIITLDIILISTRMVPFLSIIITISVLMFICNIVRYFWADIDFRGEGYRQIKKDRAFYCVMSFVYGAVLVIQFMLMIVVNTKSYYN